MTTHPSSLVQRGLEYWQQDPLLAIQYYQQAVSEGAYALFMLGVTYAEGRGVPQSIDLTLDYYQKASLLGHSAAQFNLAVHYQTGVGGVTIDQQKSLHYYQLAANNGHPEAQSQLAQAYQYGQLGLAVNKEEAIRWYKQAINQGNHTGAKYRLGQLFHEEWKHQTSTTAADRDLTMLLEKAIDTLEQAASNGDIDAKYYIGIRYRIGNEGFPLDKSKAFLNLVEAASSEHVDAMFMVGVCYVEGSGVETDLQLANFWYKEAYELGNHQSASYNLGWSYLSGNGCEKDLDEAKRLFQLNIENNHTVGYIGLAQVATSVEERLQCLMKAAEYGWDDAWIALQEYIQHPYLQLTWKEEYLAVLMEKASAKVDIDVNNAHLLSIPYAACLDHETGCYCYVCQQEQSLRLTNVNTYAFVKSPSTHIPSHLLDESSLPLNSHETATSSSSSSSLLIGKGSFGEVFHNRLIIPSLNEEEPVVLPVVVKTVKLQHHQQQTAHMQSTGIATDGSERNDRTTEEEKKRKEEKLIRDELTNLRRLRACPYIVYCYGHTSYQNNVYLVMEKAPYGTLKQLLHDQSLQPLPLYLAVTWMRDIALALEFMHRDSLMIHVDVKPDNILVFPHLKVKLADLGFSRKAEFAIDIVVNEKEEQESSSAGEKGEPEEHETPERQWKMNIPLNPDVLRTTHAFGTVPYLATELQLSTPATVQSDMFSYGMTCVHIILRQEFERLLFITRQWSDLRDAAITKLSGANTINEDASASSILIDIIQRCANHCIEQRYTAMACVKKLNEVLVLISPLDDGYIMTLEERLQSKARIL